METKITQNSDNQNDNFTGNPLGDNTSGYSEHPNYKKEQTETKRYYINKIIEVLTLVFAGAVAIFTYNIMIDTGKQVKETHRQITIYEQATHDDLRAYLGTEFLDSTFGVVRRDYVTVNWKISNAGKTPAKKAHMLKLIYPYEIPRDSLINAIMPTIIYTISSGTPLINNVFQEIPFDEPIQFARGNQPLYFGITIEYEDIYGVKHHTYNHLKVLLPQHGGLNIVRMPTPEDD